MLLQTLTLKVTNIAHVALPHNYRIKRFANQHCREPTRVLLGARALVVSGDTGSGELLYVCSDCTILYVCLCRRVGIILEHNMRTQP